MSHKVFLSYSKSDANIARLIMEKLEHEGIKTWLDTNELKPGENIFNEINKTISASDYIIILISSNTVTSFHQKEEINLAIKHLMTRNITVIPVLIEDCQIPYELQSFQFIDIRKNLEHGVKALVDRIDVIPEINFNGLNYGMFESLVSDLLVCLGFQNISSIANMHDIGGPDLTATYPKNDPFRGVVFQKWLFELKLYHNSRPDLKSLRQLTNYLETEPNAMAALITNSQLTSVAFNWLNSSKYKESIYIVDGTELRRLLIMNNDLINKYFKENKHDNH